LLEPIDQTNYKLSKIPRNFSEVGLITDYSLKIPQQNKDEGKTIIRNLNIQESKTIIGIHAGSAPNLIFKRWPLENFAHVAKKLIQQQDAHILLFGGLDEENQKQKLKQLIATSLRGANSDEAISIVSAPLLTTAAILQHCDFMLSNDSGLMHLAAASGVKTFGLFGPTDEKKTGPRGKESYVIRAPDTQPAFNTETNFHLGTKPHESIRSITPSEVIAKLPT